ncbi:MAG: hypothetical protein K8T90_21970 [Planctomycetes bacterium]|nr:hypothetical protein [Planctomycetota bacterium]
MKKLLVVGGVVAVLVAIGAAVLLTNLGAVICAAVERFGSEATQTKVTLSHADVSLSTGAGSLKGLTVGNPDGFSSPSAMSIGDVTMQLDTSSVTSETIVVKEVVIVAPQVTYEVSGTLKSNIGVIQDNVEAYGRSRNAGGGGKAGRGNGKGPGDGTSGGADAGGSSKRFIIEHLWVRGGKVTLSAPVAGQVKSVDMPEIHLTNVGRDTGGATAEQLVVQIIEAIADSSLRAATIGGLEQQGKALLSGVKDALGGLFGGGGEKSEDKKKGK